MFQRSLTIMVSVAYMGDVDPVHLEDLNPYFSDICV